MDYLSLHGPGISNFSSSSPHRITTISAAQALQELRASPTRCISTGLKDLDVILQNKDPSALPEGESFNGGVSKGKVTEIYGPPGVGKTALGMQLAASALHKGLGVTWVDASHPVPGPRFSQVLTSFRELTQEAGSSSSLTQERNVSELVENLTHFLAPSLAHLIALLCNHNASHPEPNTGLIIIDSFSTLISNAFPRTSISNSTPRKPGAPKPSSRRYPILQYLINTLQKLAVTRNIAIVVLSQCVTRMRPGAGAVLVPTISTPAWEQGLGCRVALLRDWGWNDDDGNPVTDVRLAEVVKAEGSVATNGKGRVAMLSISESGFHHLILPKLSNMPSPQKRSPYAPNLNAPETPTLPRPLKRKLSATDLEIPDSDAEDDEDYGWAEDDEEDIPVMPPQWQGSEDILIKPPVELEPGEEDPEEEAEEQADVDGLESIEGGNIPISEEILDSEDELA